MYVTTYNFYNFTTTGNQPDSTMEIEKEIKQKAEFSSEYHKMAVNIMFTASWLDIRTARKLKTFGLTPQQFNILRILRGQLPNPATVNMLIERMIDKSSNASRLVERLRVKGLVNRCMNEEDKRAVNVYINEKGLELLAKISDVDLEFEGELKNLSLQEAKELNRLLNKLRG